MPQHLNLLTGNQDEVPTSINTPLVDTQVSVPLGSDLTNKNDNIISQTTTQPLEQVVEQDKPNPYLKYFEDQKQNNLKIIKQNLSLSSMNDADQEAEIQRLSVESGLPPAMIRNNMEQVKRIMTLQQIDVDQLSINSPILAKQLSNPDFANLAYDDIEPLSSIEATVKAFADTLRSPVAGLFRASSAVYDILGTPFGLLNETYKALTGADATLLKATADYLHTVAKDQDAYADWIKGDLSGYPSWVQDLYSGVESLGSMAPGMYASIVTGNPAFMFGTGAVVAGGQATGEGLDQGLTYAQATYYGAIDAGFEFLTEKLPATRLLRDVKVGESFAKTLGVQLGIEIPQEQIATVTQDVNAWFNLPDQKDKTVSSQTFSQRNKLLLIKSIETWGTY